MSETVKFGDLTLECHEFIGDSNRVIVNGEQEFFVSFAAWLSLVHAAEAQQRHNEEIARVQVQRDEARQEVERLTARQQELLATIVRISQETPLVEEVKEALEQRGKLLAEIGTLKAMVAELRAKQAAFVEAASHG